MAAPLSTKVLEAEESRLAVDLNAEYDDRVETEPSLTVGAKDVERVDAKDLVAHESAVDLSGTASEVFVDPANPEELADSAATTSDPEADNVVGDYWPLRHPEVDGSGDDVTYRNDADYSRSSPAIAGIYPNIH